MNLVTEADMKALEYLLETKPENMRITPSVLRDYIHTVRTLRQSVEVHRNLLDRGITCKSCFFCRFKNTPPTITVKSDRTVSELLNDYQIHLEEEVKELRRTNERYRNALESIQSVRPKCFCGSLANNALENKVESKSEKP